ncbi:hypothetical protein [Enterovibrio paralichthyis]|uniref:hypothetical protein n=1 Tax=Enterovibrio paralichthyis TaxID=2853805 RepID=UPI001C44C5D4|nr:hypothetical protein [Enterovibrio paralichthyis]MBV7297244.1 hypothetical protein [Enterovibrio paralichthyis]
MANLINTSYSTNMYLNARQREKEDAQNDMRKDDMMRTGASSPAEERNERVDNRREDAMEADKMQEEAAQRGDYRGLIDRVAEREAKMAKFSAYTQGQQQLLKAVENTIQPNGDRSYDFKV